MESETLEIVPSRTSEFLQLSMHDSLGCVLDIRFHKLPRQKRSARPFGAGIRRLLEVAQQAQCGEHCGPPKDFREFFDALERPVTFKKRIELIQHRNEPLTRYWSTKNPCWLTFEFDERRAEYENLSERAAAILFNRRMGTKFSARRLANLTPYARKIPSARNYNAKFQRGKHIKISNEEKARLIALGKSAPPRMERRVRAVLFYAGGKSVKESAARAGVSRPTAHHWIAQYRRFGFRVFDRQRTNYRNVVTKEDFQAGVNCLEMLAAAGVTMPVERACLEFVESWKLLNTGGRQEPPRSVYDAVKEFVNRKMRIRNRSV